MLSQDQRDLLAFLAEQVNDLMAKARGAAAGKAGMLINEAEELMAIRASIIDRHANENGATQLQLPLTEKKAA